MNATSPVALALASCFASVGCYTSEGLIAKVKNRAIRARVDEVEVGAFRVTLPRDTDTGEMAEIDLRVFGEVERYKRKEVLAHLEDRAPQIEDQTLRTLREVTRSDLADPNLNELRSRLLTAINQELPETPLHSIGFYDVRFIRH